MQTPRPSSRTGGQSFVFVFAVVVACPGLARLHLVVCCTVFFLGRHSLSPRWFTRSAPLSLCLSLSISARPSLPLHLLVGFSRSPLLVA